MCLFLLLHYKPYFLNIIMPFQRLTATVVVLCVFFNFSLHAQKEVETAKSYLIQNAAKERLSGSDINEMSVSSAYLSPTTGWYHIYFNQTLQSVEVYNSQLNVVLKDGKVANVANNFVPNLAASTSLNALAAPITPLQALTNAVASVQLALGESIKTVETGKVQLNNGLLSQTTYKNENLSNESIEVKRYWFVYQKQEEGKSKPALALSWNVKFLTKNGKDAWNIQVDAFSGQILAQKNDVISCYFGTHKHLSAPHICDNNRVGSPLNQQKQLSPDNTYTVFDYPLESPSHGVRSVVSNPYNRFAPGAGPGATNGWHNDGTNNYTNTRGNNVWAQEDANNNDGTGASPASNTLDFNFSYTKGVNTAAGNRDAAITNLFYWNNLLHDVLWKFGFDEPSGNFQNNNQGRGGLGGDYVFADAQDGGSTDNANFYSPTDGNNGRMQMYLWSNGGSPLYQPDGDFDNGIIAHEYGHGWSIRLTGGPANSSCLSNVEQGGEGWSDYAALMFTTDWTALAPTLANANIPRGIGTYALGQPVTGAGIRPYRYSYDKTNINNPVTYAQVGNTAYSNPHGIGSIWATILWDMTWEIILQDQQTFDIYSTPTIVADMRGNVAALKLVNEGLRLQPCSPSFVDSRNAILNADQLLFNGRYRCAISRAFTRRGLGANASSGSSSNDRIVTEDYTPIIGSTLSSSLAPPDVCSNDVFIYNATSNTPNATYGWTRPVVAGISNAAGSGSDGSVAETLVNTTQNPVTVNYFFTISSDVCGGAPTPQTVKVVVNPLLVLTVAAYSVCPDAAVPAGEGLKVSNVFSNTVSGALTTASPTYNRGFGNNTTTYNASGFGTNVYYKTYTFVAPNTGNVTFEITQAAMPADNNDTYLSLYQTTFNPNSPATNFLRGDDDSGTGGLLSLLTHSLTQGTTYVLVVATFSNGVTGTFTLQASANGFTSGGIANWYKDPSGAAAPLATGSVFNPVGVANSGVPNTATIGTTTFYVASSTNTNCRTPVTFTVGLGVPLNLTTNISTGTELKKGVQITANNQISNANVEYKANNSVVLNPGFVANGNVFKAYIGGCD